MNLLAPSILAADFSRLGEQLGILDRAGAHYVHIDVMDGQFVPEISFGAPVIRTIRGCTDRVFDVHLMIDEPVRYIDEFIDAGADIISVQVEACRHLDRTIQAIKDRGIKAAAVLNPATPLNTLDYILPELDMVLLMCVNPGFGAQRFIPYTLQKVRDLRQMILQRGLQTDLEVDGGVNIENLPDLLDAGANVIVSGSVIFKGDLAQNVSRFLEIMGEAHE